MSEHRDQGSASHSSRIEAGRDMRIDRSTVAVGHSTVTGPAPTADREAAVEELRAAVDQLLDELRRNSEHYEDGPQLVEAGEQVQAELARNEPRPNLLLRWLGFIAPGVHTTAAVAADVASIQDSVTALL
ncbi:MULTISPECIES: hypothetical protein [Streptomyces]|uniref:hypothetical protein n=1 Tax=Streptomyces TaxID=1883 RepID=UPI0007CD54CF|nr:hypothetical protein A4V12_31290 [Streptomyces noursei]